MLLLLAALVTAVAVGAVLKSGLTSHRSQHTAPDEQVRVGTQKPDEIAHTTPADETEAAKAEDRGVIRGQLTYADASPARGVPVSLKYGHFMTHTDAAGRFLIDAPAGRHQLHVGLLALEEFELRPGQEYIADHVVPHGANVSGIVVAAEDGAPLGDGWPWLYGDCVNTMTFTRDDGSYRFGWVPSGSYHIVVPQSGPHRRTESVAFVVESTDIDLRIEVPIAPPLRLRFENLPEEWRETIPMYIEIVDEANRRYTVPPSNAIGGPSGAGSPELDPEGRALNAPQTPVPGKYVLRLLHTRWDKPYMELPVELPSVDDEIVVRIPDGARVVVSQLREVTAHVWRFDGLAVGTACQYLYGSDTQVVLPRVPAGRQSIWKTGYWSDVRLGQLDVPLSGDVKYVIDRELNAGIRGGMVADRAIRLLREADDALVASKSEGSPQFLFAPLRAGRYILVVDGRRIPVALNPRQMIDLGNKFAR